ncbi:MAG TPA: cell wall-binding repeat-containing protein [Solirubrobacteraceae bacterium]|nr:cell wall-binding repeat-containing protein [Solirubrobacteraceae bacterium]
MLRHLAWVLLLAVFVGCGGGGDSSNGGGSDRGGDQPVLGASGDQEQADDAPALGFPVFATKNTTRVGGGDPIADAAGVARAVYPARTDESSPRAVVIVEQGDWRAAISAAQLMAPPLRAPLLFSDGGELPAASAEALEELAPSGADQIDGAQVIRVGEAARPDNRKVNEVKGSSPSSLAQAIDRLQTSAAGDPTDTVLVAPADKPEFAMPAASWAAKSGHPVLWTPRDTLPPETRAAITSRGKRPRIYVLGPEDAISETVLNQLKRLGTARRIAGPDPVTNAIAFARYSDPRFGWNVVDPGHGLVFANVSRTLDAAAGAALSGSGKYGPLLLLTEPGTLPPALQDYLLDIQPGFEQDPVRGVYNHGWLMGDESAITADVQSRIDALLEIQPVDTGGD